MKPNEEIEMQELSDVDLSGPFTPEQVHALFDWFNECSLAELFAIRALYQRVTSKGDH